MTDTRASELIECIRFYADPENYDGGPEAMINTDRGLRARSFLAQFEPA